MASSNSSSAQPPSPSGGTSASRSGGLARRGAAMLTKVRKQSKKNKSPTGDMSLVEHLKELRRRLVISVLAIIVGSAIGYVWYQHSFSFLPALGEILRGPYCDVDAEFRADFTATGECRLLATSPMEMFMLRLKIGALAGLVLAAPVWLYQLWMFITPGLLKNERRWTFSFVAIAVTLFLAGAVLAYVSLSVGLGYLLTLGAEYQTAALTGERYFSFLLALLMIFGVSFEIPLIIAMLNVIGVLRYESVRDKRRYMIVIVFIFSALVTPAQDPFSLTILALAICLLVELSFQFCRINDKRRDDGEPDFSELDDEEASPLDYRPQPSEAASSVGRPEPVKASRQPQPQSSSAPSPSQGGYSAPHNGHSSFDDVL